MTCNRQPRESTTSFRRKRSSTRKVFPLLRPPRVVRFSVPNLSNEEPIMMFKAPWMGHPNERFLFPFGDSAEIFKLIYVLHHARNLKETQNIAKGRSTWCTEGIFFYKNLIKKKLFKRNMVEKKRKREKRVREGRFIEKCFERFEVIYGLNIRKKCSLLNLL